MKKSRSRQLELVNSKALIVGVDIAKIDHYARFIHPDGRTSKSFCFKNTKHGFQKLTQSISTEVKNGNYTSVIIGFESTGHYWKPLAYHLEGMKNINLVQVNPAHVKKAKEIYDCSPSKTDPKDTGIIGMLIQMGRFQHLNLPKGDFLSLRIFARQREQKIVELGVQRNILHSHVDSIFPEYGKVFKKLESKTSLYLLKRYAIPARFVKLGRVRLSNTLRKVSRGKISEERARQLLEAAKSSIGLTEGVEAILFAIKSTVTNISKIQREIIEIDKLLVESLKAIPYADQLLSIHGIGPVSLSIILGELGDLSRYRKANEILKMAGLNLFEISSGQHKGRRRISKRGRPLLRKTLFFAALRMVKSRGIFRKDYLRLTEMNKMQKTKAVVALSRKLLRVLFALARDKVYYNHPIELAMVA